MFAWVDDYTVTGVMHSERDITEFKAQLAHVDHKSEVRHPTVFHLPSVFSIVFVRESEGDFDQNNYIIITCHILLSVQTCNSFLMYLTIFL